jgi:hypothetical protein
MWYVLIELDFIRRRRKTYRLSAAIKHHARLPFQRSGPRNGAGVSDTRVSQYELSFIALRARRFLTRSALVANINKIRIPNGG